MEGAQLLETVEVPSRRESLHVREIEGETVVLDQQNELMHNLNITAAFIFEAIDGKRTVRQISEELAECFGITLDVAERDTQAILQQFRELKLID